MKQVIAPKRAIFELHLAVILFGLSGLFGKLLTLSPVVIVFGRAAFAALAILVGLTLFSKSLKAHSRQAASIIMLSGILLALHWVTFFHAIQLSSVAIGLVGIATFPIFVTFLEPIVSSQRVRRIDIVSAIVVMAGLALVAPSFALTDSGTLGLLWAIFSGFLFAVLTLINRQVVRNDSFLLVALYQHSSAAIILLPFVFLHLQEVQLNTVALLLILGTLCTAIPHILFIKSLTHLKAQLASIVTCLEPVYGIAFAALLLSEIPTLKTLFGTCVVLLAVVIAMRAHRNSA